MRYFEQRVSTYHDGRYAREIDGAGSLALASDPLGAEVWLYRNVEAGFAAMACGGSNGCDSSQDGCLVEAVEAVTIGAVAGAVVGVVVAPAIGKKADLALDEGRVRVREALARRAEEREGGPEAEVLTLAALIEATDSGYITIMAIAPGKRVTTIVLDVELDRLLDLAARERGVSRSEFIRRQLRRVLEQFRSHPRPRSAGSVKTRLPERGEEAELFRYLER